MTQEKKPIAGLASDNHFYTAQFRKLIVLSQDDATYSQQSPTPTPDSSRYGISIDELEKLYWTNPLVFKAINIRASRIMGEGFDLEPSDDDLCDPIIAEEAKKEVEKFFRQINYLTFFKQSCINAMVSGNEWTEMIYNRMYQTPEQKRLTAVAHGDFRTMDYRRDLIGNRILLDNEGKPIGFWQYIDDLSQLYRTLGTLYGSIDTLENLKAAKERLTASRHFYVKDEQGQPIAVITAKPNYMFINKNEIVPLSFNNLNDGLYGISSIIPAYDALIQLHQIQFALAETINNMGYPKPVMKVGNAENPPSEVDMSNAEALVQDPVRKESFVIPYTWDMTYLTMPTGSGGSTVSDYPNWFLTMIATGLRIPKELLTGDGEANRATAFQNGSDFEKDIEGDRRILEEYIYNILHYFLESRGFLTNIPHRRNPYIPKIKWKKLIAEDEKIRADILRADYQTGLITLNEARAGRNYPELENKESGEKFANSTPSVQPMQGNYIPQTETQMATAQYALDSSEKINKKLNKSFDTKNVDYKKLAESKIGKMIVSVNKAKAKKIRDIIVNGQTNKESPKSIFAKVKSIGKYDDAETTRVLVTEQNNLRNLGKLENAKKDGSKTKTWVAHLEDVDPLCKALDGQTVKIDEDFSVKYVDESGKTRTWTGSSPTAHPNCECYLKFSKGGS